MNCQEATLMYGGETSDWRELEHGAVARKWAHIRPEVHVRGPAVFRGGVFSGGDFYGGDFRGGVFRGGDFHDGVFRGGVFRGGDFRGTPLQLFGLLPWPANVSGFNRLQIGCEDNSIDEWESNVKEIVARNNVREHLGAVRSVVALAKQWFIDNPDVVKECKETAPVAG